MDGMTTELEVEEIETEPEQAAEAATETVGVESQANKLLLLLKSRKFWAALVALGLVVVKEYDPDFPLSEEQMTNLVYVIVAYILGTALEDGMRAQARS